MDLSKIKFLKSYVDLLNETFPAKIEKNVITNKLTKSYDVFTAEFNKNKAIITCVDYWIWIDKEFQELMSNLIEISSEDGLIIEFKQSYIITQILNRKKVIESKNIFIGRLHNIQLS